MTLRLRRLLPLVVLALAALTTSTLTLESAHAVDNANQLVPADYAGINVVGGGPADQNQPDLPVKAIRLWDDGVAWCDLEPQRNVFQFDYLDAQVQAAQDAGYTEIILVLGLTPSWAVPGGPTVTPGDNTAASWECTQDHPTDAGKTIPGAWSNQNPDDSPDPTQSGANSWQTYVAAVANNLRPVRRPGVHIDYQIWNEPSNAMFWQSQSGQRMAQLTQEAYTVLKTADPSARVLSASLTPKTPDQPDQTPWTMSLDYLHYLALASWPVDVITFNSYSRSTTPQFAANYVTMLEDHREQATLVLGKVAAQQPAPPQGVPPVWETEVNHGAKCGGYCLLSDGEQVLLVARTFLDDLRLGVNREMWYAFRKGSDTAHWAVALNNYAPGNPDGLPSGRAAYQALRSIQAWTANQEFYGCSDMTQSGVATHRCWFSGREVSWADSPVSVPGLNGQLCTLLDSNCPYTANVTLVPTPQEVIY